MHFFFGGGGWSKFTTLLIKVTLPFIVKLYTLTNSWGFTFLEKKLKYNVG